MDWYQSRIVSIGPQRCVVSCIETYYDTVDGILREVRVVSSYMHMAMDKRLVKSPLTSAKILEISFHSYYCL